MLQYRLIYNKEFQTAFAKHGMSRTRIYNIWALMWQRCTNPRAANYVLYGGRGLSVCEQWRDFGVFYKDMGDITSPEHTLGRKDNDIGYSQENCQWSDAETQNNNRRNSVHITAFGQTLSAPQWARKTGLSRAQIDHRIFVMGLDPETALTAQRMSHNLRRVIRSNLDGSDALEFESLASAAHSLHDDQIAAEKLKKSVWAALSRGKPRIIYAGFCWEYVLQETSKSRTMRAGGL